MASSGADNGSLIECRDLCKHFRVRDRSVRVLDGVQLSVGRGEIVVITGRTGSGKSTLLGLLGGLDRPSSGAVFLEGRRVDGLAGPQWAAIRRQKIGFLFQSFNLLPSWTAVENVEAALLHTDMPKSTRREKAGSLLAAFALEGRMEHLPSELSVGQQQLVAIARSLANEPLLLLADEPTGDVDPETAREIVSRLAAPVRARGAALIVVTHGGFPLEQADRLLRLANGTLTAAAAAAGES